MKNKADISDGSFNEDFSKIEENYIECYEKNQGRPLKVVLGLYKGSYHKLGLAAIFFVLKHSCVWVLPIVTANVINIASGQQNGTVKTILINILVIMALIAINYPMNYLFTKCRSQATRSAEAGLRGALVRKLQQLSISYHTQIQSGRLQSKVMRDVEAIETLSQQLFVNMMTIALNVIVAVTVTGTKSALVLVFFILCAPAAALTMVTFRKRIRTSNADFRREMEETSAKVMEMVEMIPVTRAHALENEEIGRMEGQLLHVAKSGYKLDIIQANFGAVGWCVFQAFQVLCLGFTGYLAYRGTIKVGDITLYQTYFGNIIGQITQFLNLLPIISKGFESVTSVGEVLMTNDIEDNSSKPKLKDIAGEFDFKNVKFAYKDDGKIVLNGFNLHVNPGETVAFVGESGAGKTTILNLIIGFMQPDSGEIDIDGHNLNDINLRSYSKHIAVVPQNSILFSGTIKENITYGIKNVDENKLREVIKAANLTEFIDGLPKGVDSEVGEHGGGLSGGQRQRISIARALMRDPKVIVLDEATSALDSISEREIQKALDNLKSERTTFIVAHRLSTIRNAEYGTYNELMEAKGEFYELRKLQVE